MKSLYPVFRYLRGHGKAIFLYFLFNLISILFSLVSLTMLIPFLSLIFEKTRPVLMKPAFHFSAASLIQTFNYYNSRIISEHGRPYALGFICIVIILAILLKNFFLYLATYINTPVRNAVISDMRRDLFDKVLRLPIGYFSEERKGDLISRMTNDLQEVEFSIMSFLEIFLREPFTILVYLFALIKLSPELTLFLLVLLPLAGFVIGRISKSLKKVSNAGQEKLGTILSLIDETVSGIRIVKAFTAEEVQQHKFREQNDALFRIKNRIYRRRDLASPLSEFLGILVLSIVLFFGGRLALMNPPLVKADVFITFIAIFSQIINPLKSFSSASYNIQKGKASAERIEKILQAPEWIQELPDALPLKDFQNSIEFQDVDFGYGDTLALRKINLRIEKGKMIALVGSSGAGKSTLVDLIPRFHDVTGGEILLDGVNIRNYRIRDLRELMGIVTQEPILFNDSIAANIALGEPGADPAAIRAAARVANADQFISQKDQGYQTNIGDRGVKLSGGEKQRLTIARAVLKNPPILILDEATSSLDTESERLVQEALYNLMENRTSIVIAHRLSTIQHADEINVLSNGMIVERGKHHELMALNGVYRRLVDMQQFKT